MTLTNDPRIRTAREICEEAIVRAETAIAKIMKRDDFRSATLIDRYRMMFVAGQESTMDEYEEIIDKMRSARRWPSGT